MVAFLIWLCEVMETVCLLPRVVRETLAVKAGALAIQGEKAAGMFPPPGSSPMAPRPRPLRPEPEELPSIPLSESQPVKKPKKKTPAKKKLAPKKESPEASGVA